MTPSHELNKLMEFVNVSIYIYFQYDSRIKFLLRCNLFYWQIVEYILLKIKYFSQSTASSQLNL